MTQILNARIRTGSAYSQLDKDCTLLLVLTFALYATKQRHEACATR